MSCSWENNVEIEIFREYLRIPTVHPDIDYTECVAFLRKQAADLNLPVEVFYPARPTKPVVVMTWKGQEPDLPSIVLNSHMDVVPVFPEKWTHPPFSADMDAEGRIFARGSQDMKCVATQYLGAVRALKKQGVTLKRTIHITFVPDEEIGGELGMESFVKTEAFKKLNVGFALDEGIASEDDKYLAFYAERSIWHLHMKFSGTAGHGSLLHKNTAGEKLHYVLNKMMTFREEQVKLLNENKNLTIGDVTTVNLTQVHGGVQSNVVPPELEAVFDIRVAITVDHNEFEKQMLKWCEEAGGGIKLEYELKESKVAPTQIDDTNAYWVALKKALDELGLKIRTQIFPGGTDSIFIRNMGIPAIGYSPIIETPRLLHDHDEFLKAETYLKGIEIYQKILLSLGNF